MHMCPPSEFTTRWPGSLHPIVFPEPSPALSADDRVLLSKFGLPDELTIYCYNDITLKFTGSVTPLATIWERDLGRGLNLMVEGYKPGEMPGDWARYWHLADQEYLQGGGWICIEENTGRLVVIDLDLNDPIYLLNSNVYNFLTTLACFLEWSEKSGGSHSETIRLKDALCQQNVISLEELEPFWMNIIDAALDDESIKLEVALGPKNAESGFGSHN